MKLMHAALAVAAVTAFATAAAAKSAVKDLDCPSAAAQARMAALEGQIGALESRLAALDQRISSLAEVRRSALSLAKQSIETAVLDNDRSPEQIDADVSRAIAEAQARGETTAHEVRAAHQAMDDVRNQMEMLRQQMQAMARHDVDADAG